MLPNQSTPVMASDALQILHCRRNYWIVITTLGCRPGSVKVFDSLYSSIDQATLLLISKPFGAHTQPILAKGPKQFAVKDCGVFGIATATLLACGGNPTSIAYEQQSMTEHLLTCLESFHLSLSLHVDDCHGILL